MTKEEKTAQQEREEHKLFLSIGDWLNVNFPGLTGGRLHNTARIIFHYHQQHFKASNTRLNALKEIAKGEGPYARDPLTFANNTIESLVAIAKKALDEN